jgi:hypothetical protein
MLPTTSEIWTRSGLAYFIVLRKRSNAHAYEHVRVAVKWNQSQYTWSIRRFQWKYSIVNTWQPTVLYRDCGQWLRNLYLRNGNSCALLIGLQDFKYWKLQLSFVRRRNPQLWYPFLESAARKIVASLPPSLSDPIASDAAETNKLFLSVGQLLPLAVISNHECCTQWLRLQLALWSLWQGKSCRLNVLLTVHRNTSV